jgi:hypothetical protein
MNTNDEYYRDVFYDLSRLSFDQLKELFSHCLAFADSARVDILDCKVSFCRQSTEIKPETYIDTILKNDDHHVFIHRRGYISRKNDINMGWHLEIGSCTIAESPDYFLFIYVDESHLDHLVEKFSLYNAL